MQDDSMVVNASSILSRILHKTHKPQNQATSIKGAISAILADVKAGRLQKAVSVLFSYPEPFPYALYQRFLLLCSRNFAIVEARKIESHLVTFNPTPPVFLLNRIIETYGKCGHVRDARELFEEMPQRDGGSWNAIITAYVQNKFAEDALFLFCSMNKEGVFANEITFASVLGSCASLLELCLSRQIHGLIVKYGFCGNVILESSLVDIYGKCGLMSDAQRMFDNIEMPNDVSWNVIVRRYLEMGEMKLALVMFFEIFRTDVKPLNFTFSNALNACSKISALKEGMQIHGVAIKINFQDDQVVSRSLIDMYVKCGKLSCAHEIFDQAGLKDLISWTSIVSGYAMSGRTREARELFNQMPERNVISWNAMLTGYTNALQWEEAFDFVLVMRKTTEDIDHITLSLILNVCAGLSNVEIGKQVHGFIYRRSYHTNILAGNALLDMYGKCGNLGSARVLFSHMIKLRDSVSWNALLTSYARHGRSEQAMAIFWEMQWETAPSSFTFGTLLAACANTSALKQGKQIHGFMLRHGYNIDIVIRGALVDMYSKCRCLEYALVVFEEADLRDVILWNSIILGCCHNGRGEKVLELFGLMEKDGIKPDHITMQGLLLACLYEGHVELAKQYFDSISHEYCIIPRMEHYECMVELFSRYGCMDDLESFVKRLPFDPTVQLLIKVFTACRKHGYLELQEWAAKRLHELNPSVSSLT